MKLLLFDIDLTLITTAGAGRAAMTRAFQRLFGASEGLDGVSFAGRTDVAIFKDALRTLELPWSKQREDDFKRLYFANLSEELAKPNSRKHVKPGVSELLQTLENRPDVVLGLLTGNWRRGAELKLRHFHLWHYF
ncbi:MAG: hydrolase, partial [Calditrichaeota bacterium]